MHGKRANISGNRHDSSNEINTNSTPTTNQNFTNENRATSESSNPLRAATVPNFARYPIEFDTNQPKSFLRRIYTDITETSRTIKDLISYTYKAAPEITKFRAILSAVQSVQMLAYGFLAANLMQSFISNAWWSLPVLLPTSLFLGLKTFVDILQNKANNRDSIQQASINVHTQEVLRDAYPLSVERMNTPWIAKDINLLNYGGIWSLPATGNQVIQSIGASCSLIIGATCVAYLAPPIVSLVIGGSLAYPIFKTTLLKGLTIAHESFIAPLRAKADELSWSRTWSWKSRLLRILNASDELDQRATQARGEVLTREKGFAKLLDRFDIGSVSINNIALGIGILSLGHSVFNNSMQLSTAFFIALSAIPLFQTSVDSITKTIVAAVRTRPALNALERLSILKQDECSKHGAQEINWSSVPKVELKGIHFAYIADSTNSYGAPILQNVNLVINPGEILAIVGDNGAGKSTLLRLLDRSYQAVEGQITIDGVSISEVTDRNLFSGLAVHPQNAMMMEGFTIREFLNWAKLSNTAVKEDHFLDRIMKVTGLDEKLAEEIALADGRKVKKFPDGLDTIMGAKHGGVELSGGELAILYSTYLYYRQPKIMCLDEPIQGFSETRAKNYYQALFNPEEVLGYTPTRLLITHDLKQAEQADRIVFMYTNNDMQPVIAIGSHNELTKNCEAYAKWRSQST